jgi:hypothetical protein
MNEDALRALIRQAIARQLTPGERAPEAALRSVSPAVLTDASHYRYALPESGGPCIIEPTVPCNHCGYCQSHGH